MIFKFKVSGKTYDSRSARVDGHDSGAVNRSSRHSASVAACRHAGNSAALGRSNSDKGGGTVVLETKSSIKGLSNDQVEVAEVGADVCVAVKSGSDTSGFGSADVNTVAEAGREGSSLTLSGGLDDQDITSDTLATLNNEVNIERGGNDISVELGANQVLEGSGGSACRRASAGSSGVGDSGASAGAVAEARLDGSESNARSSSAAVGVD